MVGCYSVSVIPWVSCYLNNTHNSAKKWGWVSLRWCELSQHIPTLRFILFVSSEHVSCMVNISGNEH